MVHNCIHHLYARIICARATCPRAQLLEDVKELRLAVQDGISAACPDKTALGAEPRADLGSYQARAADCGAPLYTPHHLMVRYI